MSLVVAVVLDEDLNEDDGLITYGDYYFFIASAIALFAAFVAPEALCTDRRTGMLGLYLAGPLDRGRYLLAKAAACGRRDAADDARAAAVPRLRLRRRGARARAPPSCPASLLRIVVTGVAVAALFAAVGLGIASLTTRKAIAGVAMVLVVLVPGIVAEIAIESGGAPDALSLAASSASPTELALRVFGEDPSEGAIGRVSTALVVAGVAAWTAARRRGDVALVPADRGAAVSAPVVEVDGRLEVVRRRRRRVRRQLHDPRRGHRAPRTERGGQVDDAPDALRARPPVEGHGARARPRPADGRRRDRADRARAAAGVRVRAADRPCVRARDGCPARRCPTPTRPR